MLFQEQLVKVGGQHRVGGGTAMALPQMHTIRACNSAGPLGLPLPQVHAICTSTGLEEPALSPAAP